LRYLPAVINSRKRIGIKKIINALYAEFERRIKRVKLKSHPFILHIELTNFCNLQCPYCLTGNNTNFQQKGSLKFEDFKQIIDNMKDYLVIVRLDGIGESFLNSNFIKMVEYATQNNIISAVSSNFVINDKKLIENLIDAGLDYLIVGLDGASQEAYEKVRPGGKLETVVENIKFLVEKKKSKKSRTPYIETQFITFEENHTDVEPTKKLSESLKVNRHLTKDLRNYASNIIEYKSHKPEPCYWLWYVLNVTWQGDLKACCLEGLASKFSFGNILKNNILDEWNNDNMIKIRKLFMNQDPEVMNEMKTCICLDCYKLKGL